MVPNQELELVTEVTNLALEFSVAFGEFPHSSSNLWQLLAVLSVQQSVNWV